MSQRSRADYKLQQLPLDVLIIPPEHHRLFGHMDEPEGLADLAESIRRFGILQPVIVRPNREKQGTFLVLAGSRRVRAAKKAGLKEVPCIVAGTDDDDLAMAILLITNTTMRQLTLIDRLRCWKMIKELYPDMPLKEYSKAIRLREDEARAAQNLDRLRQAHQIAELMVQATGMTPEEAERLLPILELPPSIKSAIDAGWLQPTTALLIARNSHEDLAALETICRVSKTRHELGERIKVLLAKIAGTVPARSNNPTVSLIKAMNKWLWSVEVDVTDHEMIDAWYNVKACCTLLARLTGHAGAVRVPSTPKPARKSAKNEKQKKQDSDDCEE